MRPSGAPCYLPIHSFGTAALLDGSRGPAQDADTEEADAGFSSRRWPAPRFWLALGGVDVGQRGSPGRSARAEEPGAGQGSPADCAPASGACGSPGSPAAYPRPGRSSRRGGSGRCGRPGRAARHPGASSRRTAASRSARTGRSGWPRRIAGCARVRDGTGRQRTGRRGRAGSAGAAWPDRVAGAGRALRAPPGCRPGLAGSRRSRRAHGMDSQGPQDRRRWAAGRKAAVDLLDHRV